MECARCEKNPAQVSCSCIVFERRTDDVGATRTTMEYSIGAETVGLCRDCIKWLALREARLLYRKLNQIFYLIWGAFAALGLILCFTMACSKSVSTVGTVGMITVLLCAAALVLFEILLRVLAVARRSDRDKLLLARMGDYPYQGHYRNRSYVPLAVELYPNEDAFRAINSRLLPENAKKVYSEIIVPLKEGRTPTMPIDIRKHFQ